MSGRWVRGRKLAACRAALLPRPLPSGKAGWAFTEVSNVPFNQRTLHRVRRWQVSGGIKYTSMLGFFVHHHFLMLSISLNQSSHFCLGPLERLQSAGLVRQCIINTQQNVCYLNTSVSSWQQKPPLIAPWQRTKTSAVSFGWWWGEC